VNLESRNILGYDTASGHNTALAHSDAGAYHGARSNPGAVTKDDGFHDETECGIRPVMVSSAEVSALGDADIIANRDIAQIVNPDIFA